MFRLNGLFIRSNPYAPYTYAHPILDELRALYPIVAHHVWATCVLVLFSLELFASFVTDLLDVL